MQQPFIYRALSEFQQEEQDQRYRDEYQRHAQDESALQSEAAQPASPVEDIVPGKESQAAPYDQAADHQVDPRVGGVRCQR